MSRPTFRILSKGLSKGVTPVEVNGVLYNASSKGPGNFNKLRQADYGPSFRQGTFGNQLDILHGAHLNPGVDGAYRVTQTARTSIVSGNTAMLCTPRIILVQNRPQVTDGRIVMDEEDLTNRLTGDTIRGVTFDRARSIAGIPYGLAKEWQNSEQMRNNPIPIVLTMDESAPEKLEEIQEEIGKRSYVYVLDQIQVSKPEITVPVLDEDDVRLNLFGFDRYVLDGLRRSFGICQ
ncbi:MAG: hypothetical protein AABX23_03785 [Nanoarchaeota archaeon]